MLKIYDAALSHVVSFKIVERCFIAGANYHMGLFKLMTKHIEDIHLKVKHILLLQKMVTQLKLKLIHKCNLTKNNAFKHTLKKYEAANS
jgi:hypothetical protein